MNEGHVPRMLEQLIEIEEALRRATEEAQVDMQAGRTTETVFEDLQARYFLAKQERETFEGNQ